MTFSETIREGGQRLRRQVAAALRDDRITMRGEILVTRPGMTDVSEEEVRASGVMAALAPLGTLFPGLKLTADRSLLSVDIRFFCYDTLPGSADIPNELCRILEDAAAMLETAGFECRIDARGEWKHLDRRTTFCCMNKGKQVSCRETGGEDRRFLFRDIRESASNAIEGF